MIITLTHIFGIRAIGIGKGWFSATFATQESIERCEELNGLYQRDALLLLADSVPLLMHDKPLCKSRAGWKLTCLPAPMIPKPKYLS